MLGQLQHLQTHPDSGLSRLGAAAAFSVDEASVKEAVVACFPLLSAVLTFRLCSSLRAGFFVHVEFCVNTHIHILARSVCAFHGHRLHRDIVVLLIASVAILKKLVFSLSSVH